MDRIFYHENCQDGWCAAYVAHKRYPEAALTPLSYGLSLKERDRIMAKCSQMDVLMVDYSFAHKEINEELANVAKSLLILDHHASKKENLEGAPYAVFDNSRSGAGLAWDYLFGKDSGKNSTFLWLPRPWWVDYTEDQDLWNWKLPNSRFVNAYLMVQPRTIESWDRLEDETAAVATLAGMHIADRTNFEVEQVVRTRTSSKWLFKGREYNVAVVNSSSVVSEGGEFLVNRLGYDFAVFWFESGADDLMHFGFRSKKGGNVDVGSIAKFFGGGGHFSSSGAEMPLKEGRQFLYQFLGRESRLSIQEAGNGTSNRCC